MVLNLPLSLNASTLNLIYKPSNRVDSQVEFIKEIHFLGTITYLISSHALCSLISIVENWEIYMYFLNFFCYSEPWFWKIWNGGLDINCELLQQCGVARLTLTFQLWFPHHYWIILYFDTNCPSRIIFINFYFPPIVKVTEVQWLWNPSKYSQQYRSCT